VGKDLGFEQIRTLMRSENCSPVSLGCLV